MIGPVTIHPRKLRHGDKVRFVSPASTPDQQSVLQAAEALGHWGLRVDYGPHAFHRNGFLAGTDDQRLGDLNAAFRDEEVRAIFATRGGKGSYRIADRLDFTAARNDPKLLVGFSDITVLHLALWKHCGLGGVHGALVTDHANGSSANETSLRSVLMDDELVVLHPRPSEPTGALTTSGHAEGVLLGGNLDSIATAAGWALPSLEGSILLLEAIGMGLGQMDRQLTMLRKAGHLAGLAGVAIGQFTDILPVSGVTCIDLLREHLEHLGVPVLGGLPLGHGDEPLSTPLGSLATLDADAKTLTVVPVARA